MLTHSPRRDAAVFRAIADPTRRAILDRLRSGAALSVDEIASGFRMSRPAVSQHLGVLRRAALVRPARSGRQRLYRLTPRPLARVDAWLTGYRLALAATLVRVKEHAERRSTPAHNPLEEQP